jgi:hypothetical protein
MITVYFFALSIFFSNKPKPKQANKQKPQPNHHPLGFFIDYKNSI